jgi:uncharacterized membrane protein YphA (DoxX/SURF4 family)
MLGRLGVPAPVALGWIVTIVELVSGAPLIVGALKVAALLDGWPGSAR